MNGPHLVVDAACASSLVALAIGAMALDQGEIDMAVVGGASYLTCHGLVLFSQAQSCSNTISRPFDDRADGLVSAEGYVAIVLKTLARAGRRRPDSGRDSRAWFVHRRPWPQPLGARKEGQVQALKRAYSAGVDPASVDYIEAHATSTQVGDATEMEALAAFFTPLPSGRRIALGSVKSNIGHTLETAGLAGLLKVVLALQHGVLPPTVHLEEPNRSVPWAELPFWIPTQPCPWPRSAPGVPRRAGVSAFGIGGLNVHVVLDEGLGSTRPEPNPTEPSGEVKIPASATPCAPDGRTQPQIAGKRRADDGAVAVIGRGVILPGALSVEAFAELIATGRVSLREAPPERWRKAIGVHPGACEPQQSPTCWGGYIADYAFDWQRYRIPPKQVARANPLQFMLLDAARQALSDAGYERRAFDRARTAVVVGTLFGGDFGHQLLVGLRLPVLRRELVRLLRGRGLSDEQIEPIAEQYQERLLQAKPALLDETGSFTSSTLASRVGKELDLMGGALAVDAGDCSSLAALSVACNLLRSRACTNVLCAGAQRSMDLAACEILSLQGRLAAGGASAADGYLPGEGVAVVLLKRLDEARRDGDPVAGVIRGVGAASDAADFRSAVAAAARRTLDASPCSAHDVGAIDAGCGVASLDGPEREALATVYGVRPRRRQPPSLIQQIGHTQAAHSLVSIVGATLTAPAADAQRSEAVLTAVSAHAASGLAYHALLEAAPPHHRCRGRCERPATTATEATPAPRTADASRLPGRGSPSALRSRSHRPLWCRKPAPDRHAARSSASQRRSDLQPQHPVWAARSRAAGDHCRGSRLTRQQTGAGTRGSGRRRTPRQPWPTRAFSAGSCSRHDRLSHSCSRARALSIRECCVICCDPHRHLALPKRKPTRSCTDWAGRPSTPWWPTEPNGWAATSGQRRP